MRLARLTGLDSPSPQTRTGFRTTTGAVSTLAFNRTLARLYSKSAKEVLAENDYKNAKLLIRQNPVVAKYAERWAANRFERYINYTAFMEDCRGEFERLWHESGGIVGGENAFDYSYEKVVLTVCEEAEKVRAQYKAKSKAKKAEKIAAKKAVKKAAREAASEA